MRNAGLTALDFFQTVSELYGIDDNVMVNSSDGSGDNNEGVEVPSINISLTEGQRIQLQSTINPLTTSQEFGVDLYMRTLDILRGFNIGVQ